MLTRFFRSLFPRQKDSVSNKTEMATVKNKSMKTKKLITVVAVSVGLAFGVTAQAKEEKHEEQTINSGDVPAAVQQAAQAEAKGEQLSVGKRKAPTLKPSLTRTASRLASKWTRTARC